MKKNIHHNNNIEELIDGNQPLPKKTAEEVAKLLTDGDLTGYDKKFISNVVLELAHTAKVFDPIRTRPKVSIFGSARTKPDHPDYILCKEFSKQMADLDYMVITGAGPGIMAAGNEGAGKEHAIGLNIDLPFEQSANEFIQDSPYLITYRYFFNRKLTFVREADAIILFPGGVGTMDEGFEALTLIQTGRAMPQPIVLMDHEGSNYWEKWIEFVKEGLLANGTISPEDMYLFRHFHDVADAADYINNFYRRYHSLRYYKDKVIIRLNSPVPKALLDDIREEYKEFLGEYGLQESEALKVEKNEPDIAHLPRLIMQAQRDKPVDLYRLIRSLNRENIESSTRRQDRKDLTPPPPRPKRNKVGENHK